MSIAPDPAGEFHDLVNSAKTSDEVFSAVPARGPEWDRLNTFLFSQASTIPAEVDHAAKRLFASGRIVHEIREWGQKYHRPEAATKIERAFILRFNPGLPVLQRQLEASLNLRLCYLMDVPLPRSIRFLTHLKIVDLRNNGLTSVPEVIRHLSGLTSLLLGFNQIADLPSWLKELKSLHHLDLEANPIAPCVG